MLSEKIYNLVSYTVDDTDFDIELFWLRTIKKQFSIKFAVNCPTDQKRIHSRHYID